MALIWKRSLLTTVTVSLYRKTIHICGSGFTKAGQKTNEPIELATMERRGTASNREFTEESADLMSATN